MAQIQSEPALRLDRRQLLASVAAITAIGSISGAEHAEAAKLAEVVSAAATPLPGIPAWNVCAVTARRLAQIAKRNQLREDAGLPLLSIPSELRRMKKAEDQEQFEAFATVHRRAVWDEVLVPERNRRGRPDWRPSGFMAGLLVQSQVNKILDQRFRVARAGKAERTSGCGSEAC